MKKEFPPNLNGAEQQKKELPEKLTGTEFYETEDGKIEVSWREFPLEPMIESEKPRNQAVIFMPGWAENANDQSLDEISEAFSESAKSPTYLVSTSPEKPIKNSLIKEAEAVKSFIKGKNLKELILAGYSKGGDKAINLANLIQESSPEINIKGLILLGPVGLYEQKASELTKNFIKDVVKTPKTKDSAEVAIESIFDILGEISRTGTNYPKILLEDIKEMAALNEKTSAIKAPIVLIQGEEDLVSRPDKVIPLKDRKKFDLKKEKRYQESKKESDDDDNIPYADEREEYLKKNLFPNSPYVKMIIAKKSGHHALPFFRAGDVVKSAIYLLDRYHREQK